MPELIDRHDLLKKVYEHPHERERMTDGEWCRKCIYEAPKVEAEPVRCGRWIFGNTNTSSWMKCSECLKSQSGQTATFSYCPNCGARMDAADDQGGGAENG